MADRTLEQIALPEGVLVISVNRIGLKAVPFGKTLIRPGDALEIMISAEIGPCSQEIRELAQTKKSTEAVPGTILINRP